MAYRCVYLAKYRSATIQRAHFALFIPNAAYNGRDLTQGFRLAPCKGTIIHVIGEPVMIGYTLEFKRNHECATLQDLEEMVFLGNVDSTNVYDPSFTYSVKETHQRATLEREATTISPPPGGQNIRAPIDGVSTKRCQEWTMEYLIRLEHGGLISSGAVDIAQGHRDPANHGILGQGRTAQQVTPSGQQAQEPDIEMGVG